MSETSEPSPDSPTFLGGCGGPATRIIFRGRTRRLFACGACADLYVGRGKVGDYLGITPGTVHNPPPVGVFTGPPKTCGEETG